MNADSRAFFDTNILVYAFSIGDANRNVALELLLAGGITGVQTMNEFVNVYTRKLKKPWQEILPWLETALALCPDPIPVSIGVHRNGVQIAQTYGYHIYDALMLAAALEAKCTVFYSEDMQDGQEIGAMTIRNPFRI